MIAPAPSRRRIGVLLVWCGGVAMVLTGAFTVAWVKLPEWKPWWVVEHSPWVEPAVRAMLHRREIYDFADSYVMKWGASIGPVLRQKFLEGSPEQRERILNLAALMLDDPGYDDHAGDVREMFNRLEDGKRLSSSAALALREDFSWLLNAACTDGPDELRHAALPLIVALRDPRWTPLLCDWLIAAKGFYSNYYLLQAIAQARDPRAVSRLIQLLATTTEEVDPERIASALRHCLVPEQIVEVSAASRHPHRQVRAWAASVIDRVDANQALEAQLLGLLSDSESDVRLAALNTVIRKKIPNEFHAAVIARLGDERHEIRRIALDAIITQNVPPAFLPAFITLLSDPAVDLRLVVIDAIGELRIREAGELLLTRLKVEPVLSLRISIIEALGRLEHIDAKPVLRQIAVVSTDPLQGAAIVTLGTLRDPTDFPLLLSLLANDDDDISRKARIALGYLPLTPEQQKQVDALWEAEPVDDAPIPAPATTSPP